MKNNFESAFNDIKNILTKEGVKKSQNPIEKKLARESFQSRSGNLSLESDTFFLESTSYQLNTIADDDLNEDNVSELMNIYFGSRTFIHNGIGTHPDFNEIGKEDQKILYGYTSTLFIDIIGSTKLSFEIDNPLIVFRIKNYILRYSIAIIQAFGGVVHRIMGDAILAFFRSNDNEGDKEVDSAIDAINSASYIIKFMNSKVINGLKEYVNTEELGLRIGIEHGDKDAVLWSSYGINNTREITATSFYVDVAAKLQQATEKNTILIGQNIKRKIGLDNSQSSHYSKVFLKFDENAKYRAFSLSQKYIDSLPEKAIIDDNEIEIKAYVGDVQYYAFSKSIPIGEKITFKAQIRSQPNQKGLFFVFTRINHGTASWFAKNNGKTKTPSKIPAIEKENGVYTAEHSEDATYKGLHSMKVSIVKKNTFNEETELNFIPQAHFYVFIR
ncbi:MAG: adenylate/guanylate cyclase domain-containing protein [Silvania sp.]|uniref:adenylate/guanylate cyclase domain-containing protein n=1 Tax=Silvania sp. TaxID=3016633 RepID=UPI003EE4F466